MGQSKAAAGCPVPTDQAPGGQRLYTAHIKVIYAGHYATETVGVQVLARHLANKFGLATEFIDVPTGL